METIQSAKLLMLVVTQLEDQQRTFPEPLQECLKRIEVHVQNGKMLVHHLSMTRRGCLRFFACQSIPRHVRDWRVQYNVLFEELRSLISINGNIQQILPASKLKRGLLFKPEDYYGLIGLGIQSAKMRLQSWLTEADDRQARVIGVYGMPGVGKTSLLQAIHDFYEKSSGYFDFVIFVTVSNNPPIERLQDSIASKLNLSLEGISPEIRKMILYKSLINEAVLLIMDDIWRPINLMEVGVIFAPETRSRILISSRSKEVIGTMGKMEDSVCLQPLSEEEGWALFERGFANGAIPGNNIDEGIAREIARECKGLPLAISVVAGAMQWKKTNAEWSRALTMMKSSEPSLLVTHRSIAAELYQPLIRSYQDLSNTTLQTCFLYCAAFPEDWNIQVEDLVQMWSGEGLVTSNLGLACLMDIGREYIDALARSCLIEYAHHGHKQHIKIHDVLRDVAIYIGHKDENWLLAAGRHLKSFPSQEETRNCKRISVFNNDIHDLPEDFQCPHLVSLLLACNQNLTKVPQGFLLDLVSLSVLDLSVTSVRSLPESLGCLGQLEFLNLSRCYLLEELPNIICNLSRLHFLNLEQCSALHSLPCGIGELKRLKHLNLEECASLLTLPHGIFQLTSLNKLVLPLRSTCQVRAEDLANLSSLMELQAEVVSEIAVRTLGPWLEMRVLTLMYNHDTDANTDDVLPGSIQGMKNLEKLRLDKYQGSSLPNCICDFRNLKCLVLSSCHRLRELPALEIASEIGSESAHGGFPALEVLNLHDLPVLQSNVGLFRVLNERTMPELEYLSISNCPIAQELLFTMGNLPNLAQIHIEECNEIVELNFETGTFPKLICLGLGRLNNLESIRGVWNEPNGRRLSNLQKLYVRACPLLRRLPRGIEYLPNLEIITGDLGWWQSIIWEDDQMRNLLSPRFRELGT